MMASTTTGKRSSRAKNSHAVDRRANRKKAYLHEAVATLGNNLEHGFKIRRRDQKALRLQLKDEACSRSQKGLIRTNL